MAPAALLARYHRSRQSRSSSTSDGVVTTGVSGAGVDSRQVVHQVAGHPQQLRRGEDYGRSGPVLRVEGEAAALGAGVISSSPRSSAPRLGHCLHRPGIRQWMRLASRGSVTSPFLDGWQPLFQVLLAVARPACGSTSAESLVTQRRKKTMATNGKKPQPESRWWTGEQFDLNLVQSRIQRQKLLLEAAREDVQNQEEHQGAVGFPLIAQSVMSVTCLLQRRARRGMHGQQVLRRVHDPDRDRRRVWSQVARG